MIYGSIIDLSFCDGSVEAIAVDIDGKVDYISADYFILSAGGLGTPIILQKLAAHCPSQAIRNAGCFYEDHPTGFIGRLQIKSPIFKYTNFSANSIKGFLRMPLVVEQEGYLVSFQLRPSALVNGRSRFTSLLSQIRNDPFNLFNYLKLLASADDLLEIVSLKLGINFPTRNYSVLMVSEQPIKNQLDVTFSAERKAILRNWFLGEGHIALIERAFLKLILELGEIVDGSELFPDWSKHISSSAHHSGTARMSVNELRGVCDENGKIHDLSNLFICDGSLIPASGFANTGLTIGALAIKLGDLLKSIIKER
ncbi:hypothetical protein G6699_09190 [Polynucleobacter paneuropaeus]|nr:hypothetical protein [Polynucleobacter paneuropaeus]